MRSLNCILRQSAIALSLCVLFLPICYGQTSAEDYQERVNDIVFSLQTIQDGTLIQALKGTITQVGGAQIVGEADSNSLTRATRNNSRVSGGALTAEIAAEVAEIQITGWELLQVIIEDEKLERGTKNQLVKTLGVELGILFSKTLRQFGDDTLITGDISNPEERKEVLRKFKNSQGITAFMERAAKEWIRTFTDLFTFHHTTSDTIVQLAVEDRPLTENEISQITDNSKRVWKIKERMYREWVSQSVMIKAQEVLLNLGEHHPNVSAYRGLRFNMVVPSDKKRDAIDLGQAELVYRARHSRRAAHLTVLAGIGTAAAIWTLFPVDYVGLTVGYDMVTPRISDFITYSALTTWAMIRSAAGAFRSLPVLRRLIEIADKPVERDANGNVTMRREFSSLSLPFLARIMRIQSKAERARATLRAISSSRSRPGGPNPTQQEETRDSKTGNTMTCRPLGRAGS